MMKSLLQNVLLAFSWQICCIGNHNGVSAFSSSVLRPSSSSWSRRNRSRSTVTGGSSKMKQFSLRSRHHPGDIEGDADAASAECSDTSRRRLLSSSTALAFLSAFASASALAPVQPAHAGLLQFPCDLNNRYHFMRAGLSELEADNIYSTNPLFLTNRDNAMLADSDVQDSIRNACRLMKESGDTPTVVYHSLAANGMDTGDLLARTLVLGRDRLLPEFTYLDQRGIGLWDSSDYTRTKKAVMAMDYYEAGRMGMKGRPPANEDGTPNETLQDQFIRLRQFLSLQESRTSGENILVIFPDGTGPAVLSCMIAGLPLNECHCLDYAPGEIRLNIDRSSVLEQFNARKDDPQYLADLEEGREILATIRKDGSVASLNMKDKRADADRAAVEEEFRRSQERKLEAERLRAEQAEKAREEAQRKREELERAKAEAAQRAKEKREEAEQKRLEAIQKAEEAKLRKREELERSRLERNREQALAGSATVSVPSSSKGVKDADSSSSSPVLGIVGVAVAGLGGVAAMAMGGNDEEKDELKGLVVETKNESGVPTAANISKGGTVASAVSSNATDAAAVQADNNASMPEPIMALNKPLLSSNATDIATISSTDDTSSSVANDIASMRNGDKSVKDDLGQIEAASDSPRTSLDEPEKDEEETPSSQTKTAANAEKDDSKNDDMDDFYDYDSNWLQVIADIRDEEDVIIEG